MDQSPEPKAHGILKRKSLTSCQDFSNSLPGILKRPSAGDISELSVITAVKSITSSVTDKFIESENGLVKPILKKKSNSQDESFSDNFHSDVPKPILKKYLSSDSNYSSEEYPRPILKMSKGCENLDNKNHNKIDLGINPILKENKDQVSKTFSSKRGPNIREVVENSQKNVRNFSKFSSDDLSLVSDGTAIERRTFQRLKHVSAIKSFSFEESHATSSNYRENQDVSEVKLKTDAQISTGTHFKATKTTEIDTSCTIAKLQSTLQKKGESGWKKRYEEKSTIEDELQQLKGINKYNTKLSDEKTSILSSRRDELDAASKQWKCRVEKSDAEIFTVSGRMEKSKSVIPLNIEASNSTFGSPMPKKIIGKDIFLTVKSESSTLKRSKSNPDPTYLPSHNEQSKITKTVPVFNTNDITYTQFYKNLEVTRNESDQLELKSQNLDVVKRSGLLVQKKDIQLQNRKKPTKNPIKELAVRDDIKHEYTEVLTGVAERELKRQNIAKLAKYSNFDFQALAGLASREDFKSVCLKKNTSSSVLRPYKDLMLIQVKGRRHVQMRLVEPTASSINDGDCYVLVSPKGLYHFVGAYSNIIEQAKAADIANYIQKTNDLGVHTSKVVMINSKMNPKMSNEAKNFWELLNCSEKVSITNAGNPSEDEIFESNILLTNMIYTLVKNELIPVEEYWGNIPKYKLLSSTALLIFDFGSEMYVWSGKNAITSQKQLLLQLAKELWNEGYDYSNCNICPLTVSALLGERNPAELPKKSSARPEWALFAKITQHAETILFKEKFLDWPDLSRLINEKCSPNTKQLDHSNDIKPVDINEMLVDNGEPTSLTVEGYNLGRGNYFFDEEKNITYNINTVQITVWKILENAYELLANENISQFYEENSYILKWKFDISVKGRKLSGKPSKHNQVGRELTTFFYWQGCKSSTNEKGVAALLTIELDNKSAPQIRVAQGSEPPAFRRLFNGGMIVFKGKMGDSQIKSSSCKLFIIQGEIHREAILLEVSCNTQQLRSRSSLVLIDSKNNKIIIWHGCKSSPQTRKSIKHSVECILESKPSIFNLEKETVLKEMEEGKDEEFISILKGTREAYASLLEKSQSPQFTPRVFHFQSISGNFSVSSLCCPYKSNYFTPLPFLQEQLYSASQPALFLIDNEYEIWLWQGWWPEREEEIITTEQRGSNLMRYQAERKAAMETAINYWKKKHKEIYDANTLYLTWAGVEPIEFQNIFPIWEAREEITLLNMKEGKKNCEKRNLETELASLSRTEFSLEELLQRPLPEGVDPTHLEYYLSPEDFKSLVLISKDDFQRLPLWKQTALKKERGLF